MADSITRGREVVGGSGGEGLGGGDLESEIARARLSAVQEVARSGELEQLGIGRLPSPLAVDRLSATLEGE